MSRTDPVVLALDCSAAACSVALWRQGALAAHRFEPMVRGQAEALMPMVDAVMSDAGCAYAALDLVAATVGPGSFTGLRIGLAAARGLALAAGVPVVGVTSFAAIAAALASVRGTAGAPAPGEILAIVIDDRRGGVYWQELGPGLAPAGDAVAVAADDLATTIAARLAPGRGGRRLQVAGDGEAVLRAALDGGRLGGAVGEGAVVGFAGVNRPPDAAEVAGLAAALAPEILAGRSAGLPPVPLYLRPPDARLPAAAAAAVP